MKKAAAIVALGLAAAAAVAYARNAAAAAADTAPGDTATPAADGWTWLPQSISYWTAANQAETEQKVTEMTATIDPAANVRAFLEAIARAEGTAGRADPYRVCYAYAHTIQSFADHPAITGEWKGEPLSAKMCAAAGFGPGCVSTAAGKYQITKGTWSRLKSRLKLSDFGPAAQDAAATELLRETSALEFAKLGNVTEAVRAARRTWASLPGAGYDQPEKSLAWVTRQFTAAGGVLA